MNKKKGQKIRVIIEEKKQRRGKERERRREKKLIRLTLQVQANKKNIYFGKIEQLKQKKDYSVVIYVSGLFSFSISSKCSKV